MKETETKLTRLVQAAQAMRREIVDRLPEDSDGFQSYDGDRAVWGEFCEATEAAALNRAPEKIERELANAEREVVVLRDLLHRAQAVMWAKRSELRKAKGLPL